MKRSLDSVDVGMIIFLMYTALALFISTIFIEVIKGVGLSDEQIDVIQYVLVCISLLYGLIRSFLNFSSQSANDEVSFLPPSNAYTPMPTVRPPKEEGDK